MVEGNSHEIYYKVKAETALQIAVSNYIKLQFPDVVFTSESSGLRVPIGLATQLKKMRSKHKLPDLIILEPKGIWHGLILELKVSEDDYLRKDGTLRQDKHIQEQHKTLSLLSKKGYFTSFVAGFDEIKKVIDEYMGL